MTQAPGISRHDPLPPDAGNPVGRRSNAARWATLVVLITLPAAAIGCLADWIVDVMITAPWLDGALTVVGLGAYNARVVVLGTTLLGAAAGVIGSFTLLRRRALVGDVLSHAMLPGIAGAFILTTWAGGNGKSLGGLLVGAAVSGVLGLSILALIRSRTRLKEDVALGLVLSVFFGLGVAMLGVVQSMSTGNAAGLESFIYGKTASMLMADAKLIAVVGAVACWLLIVLVKEFALLCFDQGYAASLGWRVWLLDAALMGLVLTVTVVGLQAVGLILMIAMLVIPAAAARFWTDRLAAMLMIAATIGGASGFGGAWLSASTPKLPAGAVIVLVASVVFIVSMVIGTKRGGLRRWLGHRRLVRRIGDQHLLRAMYEWSELHATEPSDDRTEAISWHELLDRRSWSVPHLRRLIKRATAADWVEPAGNERWRLTVDGYTQAARVTRNHRLWELYLITHADIAPSHVDRDADQIEHVLGPDMVRRLESLLRETDLETTTPASPHELAGVTGARSS